MAAEDVVATGADLSELEGGGLLHEIFTSPLNLLLLGLCIFLLYKIVRGDQPGASSDSDDEEPPRCPASNGATSPLPSCGVSTASRTRAYSWPSTARCST